MTKHLTIKLEDPIALPWGAGPQDGYRVIGSVQYGMEFGQLAVGVDGRHVQLNGSVVKALNPFAVRAALRKAKEREFLSQYEARPQAVESVVVVRKKRRVIVPPAKD